MIAALGASSSSSSTAAAPSADPTAAASAPAAAPVATTVAAAPTVTTPAPAATTKPEPVATTKVAAPAPPPREVETEEPAEPALATSFSDGSYEVGIDVAPGKYRSSGATEGMFEFCSVNTKNAKGDMVDWETANANEPVLITVKRGQIVEASGCEEFRRR